MFARASASLSATLAALALATAPAAAAPPDGDVLPAPVERCPALTVRFGADEASVPAPARPDLAALAACLVRSGQAIRVEGHTDARGTPEYALALSARRAQSVAAALVALGVPALRARTFAYGYERPTCGEPTEACRAENRRVEVVPE